MKLVFWWYHRPKASENLWGFFFLPPPTSPLGRAGHFAPAFLQLCGILTVICYSSGRKWAFASFLGTTVMFFKSFSLQLSAIVCMCMCMCMCVVKFGGHVIPSWSAVWTIRRGFCGRLQGRGHGTYLQRSFWRVRRWLVNFRKPFWKSYIVYCYAKDSTFRYWQLLNNRHHNSRN